MSLWSWIKGKLACGNGYHSVSPHILARRGWHGRMEWMVFCERCGLEMACGPSEEWAQDYVEKHKEKR